jgi:hypothetical protein
MSLTFSFELMNGCINELQKVQNVNNNATMATIKNRK